MYDHDGDMSVFQKQLDEAGVNLDITDYAGLTWWELKSFVGRLTANRLVPQGDNGQAEEVA